MHQTNPPRGRRQETGYAPTSGPAKAILSFFRSRMYRESAESVVIAFALAFLIRTFEAEAFVIPTGSMAPTLMGRHRDVDCPQCKFHFRVGASQEVDPNTEERNGSVVAATCPMCGYTACINADEGPAVEARGRRAREPFFVFNSGAAGACLGGNDSWRNGSRILVSKFAYEQHEPKRWDVFVFRPPRDASKNYIKRLVGRPGETLRIYRGDLFTGPYDEDALCFPGKLEADYKIARKPPDKVLSMKQLVHDNDFQVPDMTRKGWPTRWSSWPRRDDAAPLPDAWQSNDGTKTFATNGTAVGKDGKPAEVWVRYQHYFPSFEEWETILDNDKLSPQFRRRIRPQLITDTYAYNSSVALMNWGDLIFADSTFLGLNWVPDLVLECELLVQQPQGAALLELVAGGVPMRCRIDLATGDATLSIGAAANQPGNHYVFTHESDAQKTVSATLTGSTVMRTPGSYRLRLANVDHQLHLWINEQLVAFRMPATYENLGNVIPQSDPEGGLDLAPAGVGSEGAALRVSHMRLYRDVYYIAKVHQNEPATDFTNETIQELWGTVPPSHRINSNFLQKRARFFSTPSLWDAFRNLNQVAFPLAKCANPREDQFFAMGDNSPQSLDSRLWQRSPGMKTTKLFDPNNPEPGRICQRPDREYYVERDLLIGKALLIYWPLNQWGFVR